MPDNTTASVLGVADTENLDFVTFIDDATGTEYDTRDWGFFLAPVMEVPDAMARRRQQEVPGLDGTLDLTDALGGVNYENRELEFRFVFANNSAERYHYESTRMRNLLDGRRFRAVVSDDLGWYWVGRCQVGTRRVGRSLMELVVTMDAFPFKLNITSSYEAWKWDSFSFVDGVVTQQDDVELDDETKTVDLPIDPAGSKVKLWLNTGANVQAKMSTEQTWHALKPGANSIPEIRMSRSVGTVLQLRGTGSVGVEYRTGSL